jgi:hypothetical protein
VYNYRVLLIKSKSDDDYGHESYSMKASKSRVPSRGHPEEASSWRREHVYRRGLLGEHGIPDMK